jgi:hypothetical protein
MVLFYTNTPGDFVFHYGVEPVLFYTMGLTAMFYTMGVWGARARSGPFGVRHGMGTLLPRKAKYGIFKAVVKRYFFCSGVT